MTLRRFDGQSEDIIRSMRDAVGGYSNGLVCFSWGTHTRVLMVRFVDCYYADQMYDRPDALPGEEVVGWFRGNQETADALRKYLFQACVDGQMRHILRGDS